MSLDNVKIGAGEVVYSRKVMMKREYDVIVCGGGVAGVACGE